MTFWKLSDTRMNCLISHEELEILGYSIEDLTQDKERTLEFLDMLLEKGKEKLGLHIENGIQSFYGAFLPDRSLILSISCDAGESERMNKGVSSGSVDGGLIPFKMDEDASVLAYQILFPDLDSVIQFCCAFGTGHTHSSRLYENDGIYYLMLDFENTPEGQHNAQYIIIACEFGGLIENDAVSEYYFQEHEKCLIRANALEKLCKMDR